MKHAEAEHSVSLYAMKKIVRDSSLDKVAVEQERADRQNEIKKVKWWVGVSFGCGTNLFYVVTFVGKQKGGLFSAHNEGTGTTVNKYEVNPNPHPNL